MQDIVSRFLKVGGVSLVLAAALHAGGVKTVADAVNFSERQKAISHKILKDYAMIGMNMNINGVKKELDGGVKMYGKHLDELLEFSKGKMPGAHAALEKEKKLWDGFIKQTLTSKPDKSKAHELRLKIEEAVKAADEATADFEKEAAKVSTVKVNKELDKVIEKAAQNRYLAQRLAALYMLKVWEGVNSEEGKAANEEGDKDMAIFNKNLKELLSYKGNTPEIKKHLSNVKKNFMFFQIMGRSKTKFIPSLIHRKSHEIAHEMNQIAYAYAALEKGGKK